MRKPHRLAAFLPAASSLLLLLLFAQPCNAKLVWMRDPRAGVLDASHVVLVKQFQEDNFQVEEAFLGPANAGDIIYLPKFRLYTEQQEEPDIIEPITPDTRILLFLKHRKDDPAAWEITAHEHCFFWAQSPDKVDGLRTMAKDAIELRTSWEAARDIQDESKRVTALWPYLWNNNGYFRQHTEAELKKTGAVAGDFIAMQFDNLTSNQRFALVRDLGVYGSSHCYAVLVEYVKRLQQTYEQYLVEQGPDAKSLVENWNTTASSVKDVYVDLSYGLEGLGTFKNRDDLPYIRGLALWAVKYRFKGVCHAALEAFRLMPDRDNLSIIDAIWKEFSAHQVRGDQLASYDVVRPLVEHKYQEAVPLLASFLKDSFAGNMSRRALAAIAHEDLGDDPKAWLDWYAAQRGGRKK